MVRERSIMALTSALAGIHVVEVATYIPGPACTNILLGLGARVTKVSRPGGDPLRQMTPLNVAYDLLNAGKEERELDLKVPAGAAELRALAASADVLVDGLRPGALTRLGLGAAELRAANPCLIYCALSAYGLGNPNEGMAGHDLNLVAMAGLLSTTTVGGDLALPTTQLADLVSGLAAAAGILAALHDRARTGVGCTLDAPMLGAARWLMTPWYAAASAGLADGSLAGEAAYYRAYRTADGRHLAVAPIEPHFWTRFCAALGRPDLNVRQLDADQEALAREIGAVIAGRTLAEWRGVFADLDVCVSPALSVAEAAAEGPADLRLPVREVSAPILQR
jgi:crotonobetainyl-CoA:carnitine CoA-transferase CaiB-like acyl-CoA transferase